MSIVNTNVQVFVQTLFRTNENLNGGTQMKLFIIQVIMLLSLTVSVNAGDKSPGNPQVVIETSKGNIVLEIYPKKAPITVKNFLNYVHLGNYDGTIFHRVIPNFMIQGGGFTTYMTSKITDKPIQNEADNGLKNKQGTVAMARTRDPHSATAQFFINTKNNTFLDHRSKTSQGWGYAVFGKVVDGMDVVDAISTVKTGNKGGMANVPIAPVVIIKMTVKE